MKKILILTTLAASVTITPAAYAQSYDEQLAKLTERFKTADANGDGKLTKKEAEEGGMKRVAQYFGRLDSDGDGFVTFDQLKTRFDARDKRGT